MANQEILLKLEQLDRRLISIGHDVKMHDGEIETIFELIRRLWTKKCAPGRVALGFKTQSRQQ
ncbi:hypothetical protein KRR40_03950 [Niabella defluvii]|nr:hypothetical protein KRR40_03950 [Niabella sp. I65]